MNVLIVEDDPAMRVFIRATLLNSSLNVECIYEAANGEIAYNVLGNCKIDLILSDVNMPVMDGIEFLKKAQNHPEYRDIPAVVITTENDQKLLTMLAYWGHGYVQKPFRLNSLENQINKLQRKTREYYVFG